MKKKKEKDLDTTSTEVGVDNVDSGSEVTQKLETPHPAKKEEKNITTAPPSAPSEWTCPATESMDLSSAIALALSQTSQLPLGNDNSHHSIGATCRVYWDDECQWFSARVLLFDPGKQRHFIYYDAVCNLTMNTCFPLLLRYCFLVFFFVLATE